MSLSFNAKKSELYLYGVIGEDFWGDGITATGVQDALAEMPEDVPLTVRINSPGGIADEGIAVYNVLRSQQRQITTVVDALAASAASVVMLAGDERIMNTGARVMIHRAMGMAFGNSEDMQKLAKILDVYDASLAQIYGLQMQETQEQILQMMSEETWMTAEEAVEAKLATTVADVDTEEKPQMAAWFEHAPENLTEPVAKLKPQFVKREMARLKLRLNEFKR